MSNGGYLSKFSDTMSATPFINLNLVIAYLLWAPQAVTSTCAVKTSPQQCNVQIHHNFTECAQRIFGKSPVRKKPCKACMNRRLCANNFNVSFVKLSPFYEMRYKLRDMLIDCCGACAKISPNVTEISDMTQTDLASLNSSDFVYPFIAPTSNQDIFGFYFIPLIHIPNAYYITTKPEFNMEKLQELIYEISELWPFLVTCLMLALVSGFILWLLDTWFNEEEFPRAFYIGAFEGFWWAFISMTTVGYGDKSPRAWPGRLFAIVWILFGITICSMFTASMTTAITSVIEPDLQNIEGGKIGAIKNRLYEALVISQNGGTLHTVDEEDTIKGVTKLYDELQAGKINGFVLDYYVFHAFIVKIGREGSDTYDEQLLKKFSKVGITSVPNKGDSLSAGLLVKSCDHYHYFKKYFIDNKLEMEACTAYGLNTRRMIDTSSQNSMFKVTNGLFKPIAITNVAILIFLATLGTIYEFCCRGKGKAKTGVEEVGAVEMNMHT